ncbi:hypothetical protein CMALT430_90112 [Carnobacterium maltaromaticum]|nr:hypothetical protein CMALT430_90112 [Carnobacterium maltaromaticum]
MFNYKIIVSSFLANFYFYFSQPNPKTQKSTSQNQRGTYFPKGV